MQLNKKNFATIFQVMLDKHYLPPFEGSKVNLRDGHIERLIHGAQHVSRATLWALMMHNLLREMIPSYVDEAMATIANKMGINEEEVLLLILLTVGYHDIGRKEKECYYLDYESENIVFEALKELVGPDAKLFSLATTFKDSPSEYSRFIHRGHSIEKKDLPCFDYIRLLVALGDNLDLIRCVKDFDTQDIFDQLLNGFSPTGSYKYFLNLSEQQRKKFTEYRVILDEQREKVLEMLQEAGQFIYQQFDMYSDCMVIDNQQVLIKYSRQFDAERKVEIEHATNVFAAIFNAALKKPFFRQLMSGLDVVCENTGEVFDDEFSVANNISMRLDKKNFTIVFQSMLEKYYLQPYTTKKENIRDGGLERGLHGAQHASRATLWALVMHNFLKEIIPEYVNKAMAMIANKIGKTEEDVLLLILLTLGCHDAGRKGDGQDIWEFESAIIAEQTLKELGVVNYNSLFSYAIRDKDFSDRYLRHLAAHNIQKSDQPYFDYIRKLVALGDNLDLMRCVGCFDTKYIFDKLYEYLPSSSEQEILSSQRETMLNLIRKIHQFIHQQSDMYFLCSVRDNGQELTQHPPLFNSRVKINVEYAENVLATIFNEALKNSFFKPWMKGVEVPETENHIFPGLAETESTLFLHGTNSAVFASMVSSNFCLQSPIQMIHSHRKVPMCGELIRGGYSLAASDGLTAFGSLTTRPRTGFRTYTLERIIAEYAVTQQISKENKHVELFQQEAKKAFSLAFSNINILLIHLNRARYVCSLKDFLPIEQAEKLRNEMRKALQVSYFIQLLCADIALNYSVTCDNKIRKDSERFFSLENIAHRIEESGLDMEQIVSNFSAINLEYVMLILGLPANSLIKKNSDASSSTSYETSLPATINNIAAEQFFRRMIRNNCSDYRISDLILAWLLGETAYYYDSEQRIS